MNGFQIFLTSGDNQFGFKTGLGCRNAVYAARNFVDQFIKGGNTAGAGLRYLGGPRLDTIMGPLPSSYVPSFPYPHRNSGVRYFSSCAI